MTRIKFKNVDRFVDRHGKPRHYYRPGKGARVALPGMPGSLEFMLAYEAATRDHLVQIERPQRGPAGPFDPLVQNSFSKPHYLSSRTQRSIERREASDQSMPVRADNDFQGVGRQVSWWQSAA